MKSKLVSSFNHEVQTLFDYLIYHKDFMEWNEDEGILNVITFIDNDIYRGFEVTCKIESRIIKIKCEVTHFSELREVRYITTSSCFEDGADMRDMDEFPYDEMAQRLVFEETEFGCNVTHEVYLKPKNLWCWFLCKFCVMPHTISGLKKCNDILAKYLESKI